jgi:uncharacterized protein YjbI with pentapeptide repeats
LADKKQLAVLLQGPGAWNDWRKQNSNVPVDLSGANLAGMDLRGADLGGLDVDLTGADFTGGNFSKANLNGATLIRAKLSGQHTLFIETSLINANLSEAEGRGACFVLANLSGAALVQADFSGAQLSKATLLGACLNGANLLKANLFHADLYGADFTGATLTGANLFAANLVRTNFTGADLTGCRVYGISAWSLKLEGAVQEALIITTDEEPEITVDNLEVAQFIYLLLTNEKIRDVIDTITSKAVLILGRFTPERKAVLDALREELRKRDRTPIVFDFAQPKSKNVTDTVKLLAQLARYIIVDLSDPNSAPYELAVILGLGLDSTPVVPIIVSEQRPFPMLEDVLRKPWSTPLVRYQDLYEIRANLDEMLIKIAEAKVRELRLVPPPTA